MDVYSISAAGIAKRPADELPQLLTQPDVLVWVDVPHCEAAEAKALSDVFGFHELAIRDCRMRNHIAKMHVYTDHAFLVLHAPELGTGGHVHYVELDQFIGPNYLITVHGPLNPQVDPEAALRETGRVRQRIERGSFQPESALELSYAIGTSLVEHEKDLVAQLAEKSGELEVEVTDDKPDEPEQLLKRLFTVEQELLAIRTMSTHTAETYRALASGIRAAPRANDHLRDTHLLDDLAGRFAMVRSMADGQRDFVHGVIEFFQAVTSTQLAADAQRTAATSLRQAEASVKQNDDMRRISAWVAIIAVPTAVTGFFGQNLPYPGNSERSGFIASVVIMVVAAVVLFAIFKAKKWL